MKLSKKEKIPPAQASLDTEVIIMQIVHCAHKGDVMGSFFSAEFPLNIPLTNH